MSNILQIAVSGRSLFNMELEDEYFKTYGLDLYVKRQIDNSNVVLNPGPAFPLIKRLLDLNAENEILVNVTVISGQHPFAGIRIINSAHNYGLSINRSFFTGGMPSFPYVKANASDIFLTRSLSDAQSVIDDGIASAVLSPLPNGWEEESGPIRIALDGDAVIFSDDCEAYGKENGLPAFYKRQADNLSIPIKEGPFADFLTKLDYIRKLRPGMIRICLVTARDGVARDRALATLLKWKIQPDEAFFVGDLGKGEFVKILRPHIFLDDTLHHVISTENHTPSGLVPYIKNGAMNNYLKSLSGGNK